MPNPPKPMELKRLTGRRPGVDIAGRPLPDPANTVALQAAERMPAYPEGIGDKGAALWRQAWGAAIVWLSPEADRENVERACRLADYEVIARERYMATTSPSDGSILVKISHELGVALSELGFGPVARSRLGVAEVTRVSKLDKLRRRDDDGGRVAATVVDADFTG